MTFTNAQSRKLAKWLGIKPECVIYKNCIVYGGKLKPRPCYSENGDKCQNLPDFSRRDAFWLIMEKGPGREGWDRFTINSQSFILFPEKGASEYLYGIDTQIRWAIKQDYIGVRLAESLLEFIEKEGE